MTKIKIDPELNLSWELTYHESKLQFNILVGSKNSKLLKNNKKKFKVQTSLRNIQNIETYAPNH